MNVLYTGAASGIAKEVICNLKDDKSVFWYLTVHTDKQLIHVKKQYQKNKNIAVMKLDITNLEDYHQLDYLDIDVVIHNAAVGFGGSLFDMSIDKVKENYETNVFGTLRLTQYLFLKFQKQKHGRMIFMSSLASILQFLLLEVMHLVRQV